jgi:hypothetical protein
MGSCFAFTRRLVEALLYRACNWLIRVGYPHGNHRKAMLVLLSTNRGAAPEWWQRRRNPDRNRTAYTQGRSILASL